MASYSGLGQIASQSDFLLRIRYAAYHAAIDVFAEDPGTPSHAERVVYAAKVTSGSFDVSSVAYSVLTNPTIAAGASDVTVGNGITDGDLQFAVNSVFNALAGV